MKFLKLVSVQLGQMIMIKVQYLEILESIKGSIVDAGDSTVVEMEDFEILSADKGMGR
jgi:hypothetical protein